MVQDPAPPRDYRKEVTDKLIQLLEQGVAPWQQPWKAVGSVRMPYNPTSGKAYRGGNALYLLSVAIDRGLNDPRWMTYKQAAENGWQVRRGERGTQIEFWDRKPAQGEAPAETSDEDQDAPESPQNRLIHRIYTVFNAGQIAGIPPLEPQVYTSFEVVEAGESILAHSGADITHDQRDRAFYDRKRDAIHLPDRAFFEDASGYYGTALHELAHWTGHPSRLNRATLTDAYKFGDVNYAKEELRAEIASLFLAAERGIPHEPESHAAYVASWIKALKHDKNEIFRAAQDAAKATDYLLELERSKPTPETSAPQPEKSKEESQPVTEPVPTAVKHVERVTQQRELTLERDFDGPD